MSLPSKPSDCHQDLQDDRLLALAQFFASTRSELVSLHDPTSGDDSWSLGCRGFARWRNLLSQKALAREWDWLGIVNPGKRFIFSVGSVPVRFYRGSIKNPPFRTLASSAQELTQMSLAFTTDANEYGQLKWRFAIETDHFGEPSAVIFAGLAGDDGTVVCHWKLPFDTTNLDINIEEICFDDVVELPPPAVVAPIEQQKIANDE